MAPLLREALARLQGGQRRDRLAWLIADEQIRFPEGATRTLDLAAQATRLKRNRRHERVRYHAGLLSWRRAAPIHGVLYPGKRRQQPRVAQEARAQHDDVAPTWTQHAPDLAQRRPVLHVLGWKRAHYRIEAGGGEGQLLRACLQHWRERGDAL